MICGEWKTRGGVCGVQANAACEPAGLFYCMAWNELQARVCNGRTKIAWSCCACGEMGREVWRVEDVWRGVRCPNK